MKRQVKLVFMIAVILLHSVSPLYSAKINDDDLKKKQEGWYPTGLPLVNYSSDDGVGYGLRAYIYYNGYRNDNYFDASPYFMRCYGQYFATTNGIQYHEINFDFPYIAGTRFRLKTSFVYDKDLNANYFGLGGNVTKSKLTDYYGNTYSSYEDYEKEFLKFGDSRFYKYDKYTITKPTWYMYLYRDLTDNIKIMSGLEFKKAEIELWDGRSFDLGDTSYVSYQTRLSEEKPFGCQGGWTNFARFGIGFDTRDYEPDPNRGVYIDYAFEVADGALGSDYDFIRSTAAARLFISLVDSLVFAVRGAYTDSSGDVPFYAMNKFGFADIRRDGLGGNRTLRGYKKYRFVGKTMTMGNAELRWQFAETVAAGQRFGFQLIGFVDSGNVYDNAKEPFSEPGWGDYRNAYGGGLVIAWNLATIVHIYYGMSEEDTGIFVNFEHNF